MKSLDKIIAGCKKNKPKDQALLFEMFSDKMFGTCLYYSSNREDAEDLLHDGFLKIFENIKKYEDGNLEAWMRRVFINLALMRYRRNKHRREVEDVEALMDSVRSVPEDNTLHANELMAMISRLPTRYRLVFNLYAIEGFKHKEIAGMLDISEGTSKSNLSRARQILQQQLKSKEDKR